MLKQEKKPAIVIYVWFSYFKLPCCTDAVVLQTMRVRITLRPQGTSVKCLLLRTQQRHRESRANAKCRRLRQDKRILACATMRGKRCPKHAALRFALVSKIRVLKGWFSPENGDCSLIEHLGRGNRSSQYVTSHLISRPNDLNNDGGSHCFSLHAFLGYFVNSYFLRFNPPL